MVEFAIVLPIMALLLVMAIDFGRVFFGWVALQNAARIAADTASQRADAWPTASGDEEEDWRDDYETFITQDLQAANCEFPLPHPDPTFTNANLGDPDDKGDHDFGDLVTVRLECDFSLITPLAGGILGDPIHLEAESTFSINGLVVVGVPDPPPPPPEPCTAPVASFTTNPAPSGGGRVNGSSSPFIVDFTSTTPDTEDCPIDTYVWTVDGVQVGTDPELLNHPFTDAPGGGPTNYVVLLTVTSDDGTDDQTITVRVTR